MDREAGMKMIHAIFRPERETAVLERLEAAGYYAMTRVPVLGRGQQRGIQVGAVSYDELAKVMLMIVVEDDQCVPVVRLIEEAAWTGHPGDGKIFIQAVREAYTVRTGVSGL
jgi:nitrogen regulatory protein PII 1